MDAVILLNQAWDAGLQVHAVGNTLKIIGPKRAEPLVRLLAAHKAKVLAALSLNTNEPQWWRNRYTARAFEWSLGDRTWEAARRLAWGDLQNEWHTLYGLRWPQWQCSGCDAPMHGRAARGLPDGNRVHFKPIDCLNAFGKRWRGDADAALIALGLEPPDARRWVG